MSDKANIEAMAAYQALRTERPELFENATGVPIEILPEGPPENAPYGVRYRDEYITLVREPVKFDGGRIGTYHRVIPSADEGGAAILPVYDGRIILIHHFRHATRKWHWEIPRGFSEAGETIEETARRELKEEINVASAELRLLGHVHADTGLTAGSSGLFWAALTMAPDLANFGDEAIDQMIMVTPEQLDAMQERGEITDSFTMAAILNARQRGLPPFDRPS